MRHMTAGLAATILATAAPAAAADDSFEFWLNPSVSVDLDDDTGLELETAQRFRNSANGADTYFARLWVNQSVARGVSVAGAVEQRINNGGSDETRLMQQLSLRNGFLRGRLRLEQRFVENADRTGWRIRPRVGVAVPLDQDGRWGMRADVEAFVTLQPTSIGGQDGLTGIRTQLGVSRDINDRLTIGLTYLRQQDIRRGGPDTVGHAPLIGIELAL
jgi:hypothetical protein